MKTKDDMFVAGVSVMLQFCKENSVKPPDVERLNTSQRNYHLGTCAYYRPFKIHIMVEKCALKGLGGASWSWPGYVIDRTPFGVLQHELGHHVDTLLTGNVTRENLMDKLFSRRIWEQSQEPPLTNYFGTDKEKATFFMEWFAENFRLYVTNPGLCLSLRPRFYIALFSFGIYPLTFITWKSALLAYGATQRIITQAEKKISEV